MQIVVTGAAGFIGFHVGEALLQQGHHVTGFDNLNAYYDPSLKQARLLRLQQYGNFSFARGDLADREAVEALFKKAQPRRVIHLAAQAGVRHSMIAPRDYIQSNLAGFLNILEGARHHEIEHLVFASSSSVYGLNSKLPFSERDITDRPASLYGATKKSNELMAYSYAHLYNIRTTGLRFFTVYGPWGRPDMAPMTFTKAILEGRPIDVYNNGQHSRDFTYIADAVEGVIGASNRVPAADGEPPSRIYNIGNNIAVKLLDFISCLERATGKDAVKNFLPKQPGDVDATFADIDALTADTGFKPSTSIETGIPKLVDWYRGYYNI